MRNGDGEIVDERPQNTPDTRLFNNINKGSEPWRCPARDRVLDAASEGPPRRLAPAGTRTVEFIHGHRDGENRRNEHYTICRLGVPVRTLVWEVREGLHPHYEVRTEGDQFYLRRKNGKTPEWRCGMVCPMQCG